MVGSHGEGNHLDSRKSLKEELILKRGMFQMGRKSWKEEPSGELEVLKRGTIVKRGLI